MIETLPTPQPTTMTPSRCPEGQRLFKKWANRVRFARYDQWQAAFFHKTRYGYDPHVSTCDQCQAHDQKYKRQTNE